MATHVWRAFFIGWAFLAGAGCERAPQAQNDCRVVEILVGFGVGGGTDLFARSLSAGMEALLEKPVQVVNYAGGAGRAALRELLKRPANGCTLLAITSDYVILSALHPDDVNFSKLRFIARAHFEIGLLSGRNNATQSWESITAAVQDTGRPLLVGGIGADSFDRATVAKTLEGVQFRYRYIPYQNAKEMQADLIGGRLDVIYDEVGVMLPLYQAGQAQPLIVLHDTRIDLLPDVPSTGELGLNTPSPIWRGIAISADAPDEKIAVLEKAVWDAMKNPSYKEYESRRRLDLIEGSAEGAVFEKDVVEELAEMKGNILDL